MALQIHPDLQSLIPPLSPDERAQLEANLLEDGCLNPLIVWQEKQILLDGHHRYAICTTHDLIYHVREIPLPDLDAAKAWLISHQLGRRNLTPDQMSYYRGEQYNLQKHRHGGDRKSEASSTQNGNLKTVDKLAGEHGVSRNTIARDGAYAAAVETLATMLGPDARQAILTGHLQLTKQDVPLLASLVEKSPQTAAQVKAALVGATQGSDPAPVLRAIVTASRCGICSRPLSDPASVSRGIGPICAGHGSGGSGSTQSRAGVLDRAAGMERFVQELERARTGEDAPPADETPAPPFFTEVQDPAPPKMAPSTLQQTSTGDYEWYTPREVVALVREVLGEIAVDPASCPEAQANVQARTFYTSDDDGLRQPWPGTVFCNPPYKMPEVARFIGKLCEELDAQRTTEAILLVNSATETDWFQRAFARANAVCFPDGRMHFLHATRANDHPCQGQALLYFGPHADDFCVVFAALGVSTFVVCADAPEGQLDLTAAPPTPPAPLIREADYCIVHLPPSKKGSADFEPCTLRHCHETAHYRFWTHDPRPTGRVWVHHHDLCPAYTAAWCTAHQVDIGTIPTIAFTTWARAWEKGAYDQLPWFRYAPPAP